MTTNLTEARNLLITLMHLLLTNICSVVDALKLDSICPLLVIGERQLTVHPSQRCCKT